MTGRPAPAFEFYITLRLSEVRMDGNWPVYEPRAATTPHHREIRSPPISKRIARCYKSGPNRQTNAGEASSSGGQTVSYAIYAIKAEQNHRCLL